MSITVPPLISVGEIVTAAYLNTHRSNWSEIDPSGEAAGALLYANATPDGYEFLEAGAAGQALMMGASAPQWGDLLPPTWEVIASGTSSLASSIVTVCDVSSIPSDYDLILIRFAGVRLGTNGGGVDLRTNLNGLTSSIYYWTRSEMAGTSWSGNNNNAQAFAGLISTNANTQRLDGEVLYFNQSDGEVNNYNSGTARITRLLPGSSPRVAQTYSAFYHEDTAKIGRVQIYTNNNVSSLLQAGAWKMLGGRLS